MSLTTYEVDDRGVALIQLDRANALNAINVQIINPGSGFIKFFMALF